MSAVLKRVTIDLVLKSYSMLISYTVKLGCYNNIFKCKLYIYRKTLKKLIYTTVAARPQCYEAYCAVLENIFHLIIIYSYCICIDY